MRNMPPKRRTATVAEGEDDINGLTDVMLKEILTAVRENGDKLNANTTKLENLEKKYENLTLQLETVDSRVTKVEAESVAANDAVKHYQEAVRRMEIATIRNEENSRRFNGIAYTMFLRDIQLTKVAKHHLKKCMTYLVMFLVLIIQI